MLPFREAFLAPPVDQKGFSAILGCLLRGLWFLLLSSALGLWEVRLAALLVAFFGGAVAAPWAVSLAKLPFLLVLRSGLERAEVFLSMRLLALALVSAQVLAMQWIPEQRLVLVRALSACLPR